MNVFDLQARIGLDTSGYDSNLNRSESRFSAFGSKLKTGVSTAAKVTAAGLAAAAAGVTAISQKAIEAYANYEQLVGGVETLFGAQSMSIEEYAESVGKSVEEVSEKYNRLITAQENVMENSRNAFRTAGLSANEYMDTVTSFSASLIASLGGDTKQAAEYANRAIVDMSDNANKMGTSMEMIQNAYQGFAKQNYTMLDNLKLGYGGTQEELDRLITDASKMTDVQERLGLTVEDGSRSFGNIVNAISVMQSSLGIMGTTAKEAESTIQGSISMMRSAWENLITGVADDTQDFDSLISNFVDSIDTVAGNILPRVETALAGVGKLVEKLVPQILNRVPNMLTELLPKLLDSATNLLSSVFTAIRDNLPLISRTVSDVLGLATQLIASAPEVADMAVELVAGLGKAIIDNVPALLTALGTALSTIGDYVVENAPALLTAVKDTFVLLADYIADAVPQVVPAIVDFVMDLAEIITEPDTLSAMIDAALVIVMALTNGILDSLPVLIERLPKIVDNIVKVITENLPKIFDAAIDIVKAVANAILVSLPSLVGSGRSIIDSVMAGLVQVAVQIYDFLDELGSMIAEKIIEAFVIFGQTVSKAATTLIKAGQKIIKLVTNLIKPAVKKLKERGIEIIANLIAGITQKFGDLKRKIKEITEHIKDSITDVVKKMTEWGRNLIGNFIDGIKNKTSTLFGLVRDIIASITKSFSDAISKAVNWGRELIGNIATGVKNKASDVLTAVSGIISGITDRFAGVISSAIGWGRNLIGNFIDNVKSKWENVKNGISDIVGSIAASFADLVMRAVTWGKNIISHFVGNFKSKWGEIGSGVSDIVGNIAKAFTDKVENAWEWGKDLVQNFINGLEEKKNLLTAAATGLADVIKDRLGFSEPKLGPLSNFHTYAPDMIQLFTDGIKDNTYRLVDTLDRTFGRIGSYFDIPHEVIGNVMASKDIPRDEQEKTQKIIVKPFADNLISSQIRELTTIAEKINSTVRLKQNGSVPAEKSVIHEITESIENITTNNAYRSDSTSYNSRYAAGDTIINISVASGVISTDYDASRAAYVMSEKLAAIQAQNRKAVGL